MGSVLRILGGVRSDWFVIGACLVGAAFCFVDGNWYAVLGWLTGALWSLVAYAKQQPLPYRYACTIAGCTFKVASDDLVTTDAWATNHARVTHRG